MREKSNSRFDAGIVSYIGICLASYFLFFLSFALTFGIACPWVQCAIERWYARHTIIDGKRLRFDGKGIQLLLVYLKFILLTIITAGIYLFFTPVKLQQWTTKHTHFDEPI